MCQGNSICTCGADSPKESRIAKITHEELSEAWGDRNGGISKAINIVANKTNEIIDSLEGCYSKTNEGEIILHSPQPDSPKIHSKDCPYTTGKGHIAGDCGCFIKDDSPKECDFKWVEKAGETKIPVVCGHRMPCPCHSSQPSVAERCKTSSLCSHNKNGRSLDKPCSIEHSPQNNDCHYECKGLCNAAMPFCTCGQETIMHQIIKNQEEMNYRPVLTSDDALKEIGPDKIHELRIKSEEYNKGYEQGRAERTKEVVEIAEKLKLECDTVTCDCGEKLKDWDIAILVSDLLAALRK